MKKITIITQLALSLFTAPAFGYTITIANDTKAQAFVTDKNPSISTIPREYIITYTSKEHGDVLEPGKAAVFQECLAATQKKVHVYTYNKEEDAFIHQGVLHENYCPTDLSKEYQFTVSNFIHKIVPPELNEHDKKHSQVEHFFIEKYYTE